jgi:hypothetical protein
MINRISFIFIIFSFIILAQEEKQQNPNVELPDFVITGTDIISIRKAQKIEPDYVSTISEQFLKPVYSPEELGLRELSSPLKEEINMFDSLNYIKGILKFNAGVYTLPLADLSLWQSFRSGMFDASLNGENHRPHVDNSDRYLFGGGLNLLLAIDNNSEFLPGTQFKFHGDYYSSAFKFYSATENPIMKRTLGNGNFSLKVSNLSNKTFIFGFQLTDYLSNIQEETYTENLIDLSAFANVKFANFNLGVDLNLKKQSLENETAASTTRYGIDRDKYFSIKPTAGFNLSKVLKVTGGITYSESGGSTYTSPYAALGLKLNRNISIFGEYSPQTEFLTSNYFLKTNRYFNPQSFNNLLVKKSHNFKAVLKYEYDKYFQIDGGFKYYSSPALPFFTDSIETGSFSLSTADAKSFSIFSNLLFHLGPFGIFYGTVEYNKTTNTSGNLLPYYPEGKASITYGYNFDFGLNTEATFYFTGKSFTDIGNTSSLPAYYDLGLKAAYEIVSGFYITLELSNILSNDIYYWKGYKEAPFDFIGGFNYRW